jgi:predicted RNase H-like nuclease (RuvC/YqgF family)
MNIQPPTIPKNIEDEEIQTHESLLKIMETYKSTIEAKDKLNNEINEKSELVSKMCEIFNISKRIIKNEENMNDIQKVIYNLETEVSEKKVEVDNLEKKSKELRWLIINNEKKIYEYTIDNMKLFTNFLKIKEGTAYNEIKLVEAVNKMITTPMELLFKKPDLSVCGYNTENYAVYDNDEPVNTDNTKLSEVLIPFNNNSRTFLLKTNDLRDMAAIKN